MIFAEKRVRKNIATLAVSALVLGFMMPYMIDGFGISKPTGSQIQGVETEQPISPELVQSSIELKKESENTYLLYLNAITPFKFAATELYLQKTGELKVQSIICESGVVCLQSDDYQDQIVLAILRSPTSADESISGSLGMVRIVFSDDSQGTLTVNPINGTRSTLYQVGTDKNLLLEESKVFAID